MFSDSTKAGHKTSEGISKNKRRKIRRNTCEKRWAAKERELNEKFLRKLSPISYLTTKSTCYQGVSNLSQHPCLTKPLSGDNSCEILNNSREECASNTYFTVKIKNHILFMSNRIGCLRFTEQSIALESYLESVKTELADITINKPKNNLSRNEMAALKELRNNSAINLKKADKGTTTVIMNKSNKIQEAEVQLENREHYKPLEAPMVNMTQTRVNQMACSNPQPAKNPCFLNAYKNPQTCSGRKTDHLRL